MKRLVVGALVLVLVLGCAFAMAQEKEAEPAIDLSTYSAEFEWRKLFRRPKEHIGEKYIIRGNLCSVGSRSAAGGYDEAWIELDEYVNADEYMLLWIDPLDFNLLENDWVDVYVTITGTGPLSKYSADHEVFYAHVDALMVYDEKDGEVVETYVQPTSANSVSDSVDTKTVEYKGVEYLPLDYESNERNPDAYIGQHITFSGNVIQVFEKSGDTIYRIATRGQSADAVLVEYNLPEGMPRILEKDKVTVYGVSTGVQTYESTATRITVPACLAVDIIIISN